MLENIKIVLVRTFHPGNIGSALRSMKTMGLSKLVLVNPKDFPSSECEKMAAGAKDLISSIEVVDSINDAIADCTLVIASTARPRGYDLPELDPTEAANFLVESSNSNQVALIFGPERMGLHNEDLRLAKYRVTIPANPDYNSLNLAAAVQTLGYEIYKSYLTQISNPLPQTQSTKQLPTAEDIARLHQHIESVLMKIKFLRTHQGETMQRIQHMLTRTEIDAHETNILRGILGSIEKTIDGEK